ncbi:hypothetical protein K7X08_021630 [Anisodus acutangulus]|uniref:Uncharacterized protein n=1 Tax=Anisodus acutangulus TaxID=402998 RepID=A0A9Q1M5S7_9SOLA|nr:hypothetical protein K7X08_021630 [Anisodus acutangulus]
MVGAFPLDRELPASSLHLTEWSTKESMDVLETFSSKVFNTTILVLKSSTHSKEAAATCPKGSNDGLTTWGFPRSGFGEVRLRSSYVTTRIDDVLVIEPYSPHRFSGQFGFSQDLPGDLIERTYDGTLQELVQLGNSCTRFSSSSTVIISPRPAWPLMTRRYTDWWSAGRASLVGHTKIILKCSKRNDTHAPSKVRHPQPKDRIKPSSSFVKSKTSQLSFKSSTSKGVLIGAKPLSSTSKLSSTPSMVSDNTCKRKDPPTSSENNTGNMSTEVLCNDETLIPLSVDEALVIDGATS